MLRVNLQPHGKTQDENAKKTAPGGQQKCEGWSLNAHFSCSVTNGMQQNKHSRMHSAMQIQTVLGFVLVQMPDAE